jgi:hypothetical protein
MINTCLYHFCREPSHCHHCASTMLVALHPLINVMCDYTPSVHSNAYYISKLLLVGCLAPVCLRFASSQYVHLKFTAQLVQGINLHSVCKKPQAIEVFHYNAYTVIRFNSWCLAICCLLLEIIDLPSDLIFCARFMLCYLECCFNKVGVVISQQGSSILSLYQRDQFSCRWSGPAVEVPSASIKLS